jgi:hypothetical protein
MEGLKALCCRTGPPEKAMKNVMKTTPRKILWRFVTATTRSPAG